MDALRKQLILIAGSSRVQTGFKTENCAVRVVMTPEMAKIYGLRSRNPGLHLVPIYYIPQQHKATLSSSESYKYFKTPCCQAERGKSHDGQLRWVRDGASTNSSFLFLVTPTVPAMSGACT